MSASSGQRFVSLRLKKNVTEHFLNEDCSSVLTATFSCLIVLFSKFKGGEGGSFGGGRGQGSCPP